MHNLTTNHWTAAKRILRYVKGIAAHGLFFQRSLNLILTRYFDVDWAENLDDRRSTIGVCIFLSHNLISWSAKKQHTVAKSSIEFGYHSLAHSAAKLSWLLYILRDLHIPMLHTPIICCDNIDALSLASNPIFHARTKHISRLIITIFTKRCCVKSLLFDSFSHLIS